METSLAVSLVAIVVATVPVVIGILYQRNLSQRDTAREEAAKTAKAEQDDYRRSIHDSFGRLNDKLDELEKAQHLAEVALAKTMTQQDLNAIFMKIDALRNEVKEDIAVSGRRQDDIFGKVLVALTARAGAQP